MRIENSKNMILKQHHLKYNKNQLLDLVTFRRRERIWLWLIQIMLNVRLNWI